MEALALIQAFTGVGIGLLGGIPLLGGLLGGMTALPLVLTALGAPAWGQVAGMDATGGETQVSEITVTATRTPKEIVEAPATVSTIDQGKVRDRLVSDIKDLVRYEPGVSVRAAACVALAACLVLFTVVIKPLFLSS